MNNNNIYGKSSEKSHVQDEILAKKVQKLYSDTERAVPEYGEFSKLKVRLKNKDENLDVKDVVLTVKPSILLDERPKEREIEISVKSYNELYTYSVVLARGEKDEILKTLQDESFLEKVDDFIIKAADKFKDVC